MGVLKEFKEFAMRGNVIDLAVGVIVGGAFGKITTSLVNDVIMPPIGLLIGGMPFSKLSFKLKEAQGETPAVTINYGLFLETVIDFLIVAFVVFMLVKLINQLSRKEEKVAEVTPPAPPAPTKEEVLLTEIRDILKNKPL